MKFFVILLSSAGGILLLVFLLSLVFSAQLALQPTGIAVASLGALALIVAWLLQSRFSTQELHK